MNTLSFLTRWIGQVDGVAASVHKSLKGQAKSPHVQSRFDFSCICFRFLFRGVVPIPPSRKEHAPHSFIRLIAKLSSFLCIYIFLIVLHSHGMLRVSHTIDGPFVRWKSDNNSRHANRRYHLCILQFSRYFHRGWKCRSTWYNNSYALHHP